MPNRIGKNLGASQRGHFEEKKRDKNRLPEVKNQLANCQPVIKHK